MVHSRCTRSFRLSCEKRCCHSTARAVYAGASSEHPLRSSQGRVRAWTAAPSTLPNPRVPCAPQAATVWEGDIHAPGCKFAVVVGQFNSLVTDRLESGALAGLRKAGVEDSNVDVVHVPGSFEIPVVAKSMAMTGKYDAVICIGAVVRGATTHYEEVCGAATTGCGHAAVSTGVPIIFGVITTETMEQALDRAGGKVGNKGFESAMTAIEMASVMSKLRAEGKAAAVSAFL